MGQVAAFERFARFEKLGILPAGACAKALKVLRGTGADPDRIRVAGFYCGELDGQP